MDAAANPVAALRPRSLAGRVGDAVMTTVSLLAADCLIRVVPFGLIARRIGAELRWRAPAAEAEAAAQSVRWAIMGAQRRIPWTVPCLARAVAANRLLARRGVPSELWLGARPAGTTIEAHAWLVAGGRVVTGSAGKSQFTPLHSLVTSAPPPA